MNSMNSMNTTIKVEVALPLTTAEVEEVFKQSDGPLDWEQIEGCTTSQTCKDCGERIWMQNYGLAIKPTEFPCPYCYERQQHLFAGVPTLNSSAFSSPIYGALRKKASTARFPYYTGCAASGDPSTKGWFDGEIFIDEGGQRWNSAGVDISEGNGVVYFPPA